MTLQFPQMPEQITKAESRILDYISNNPEEFLLSSIGEVGEKLDVSGTTISLLLIAVKAVGLGALVVLCWKVKKQWDRMEEKLDAIISQLEEWQRLKK